MHCTSSSAWLSRKTGRKLGLKKANELGLYDMSGNVEEWCADGWRVYDPQAQTDPKGPVDPGSVRMLRGGSISCNEKELLVARRGNFMPERASPTWGFRVARSE